jgi:hypothetical protein
MKEGCGCSKISGGSGPPEFNRYEVDVQRETHSTRMDPQYGGKRKYKRSIKSRRKQSKKMRKRRNTRRKMKGGSGGDIFSPSYSSGLAFSSGTFDLNPSRNVLGGFNNTNMNPLSIYDKPLI